MKVCAVANGYAVSLAIGLVPGGADEATLLREAARTAAGYASLVVGLTVHSLEVRAVDCDPARMQRWSFDGVAQCRHQCLVEVAFAGSVTDTVDAAADFARLWREGRAEELAIWERSLAGRAAWHGSPEYY